MPCESNICDRGHPSDYVVTFFGRGGVLDIPESDNPKPSRAKGQKVALKPSIQQSIPRVQNSSPPDSSLQHIWIQLLETPLLRRHIRKKSHHAELQRHRLTVALVRLAKAAECQARQHSDQNPLTRLPRMQRLLLLLCVFGFFFFFFWGLIKRSFTWDDHWGKSLNK